MNIAIVGAGIAGLTTARLLNSEHQVTVFEADDRIGGHTNTIDVEADEGHFAIDTGFIVFNDRTYPNFIALMDELEVASQKTIMSFSVKCASTGLEYRGADPEGLFAQRRNLINPKFYRLLYDLIRFNRCGNQLLEQHDAADSVAEETVGSFLERHKFSQAFINQYFLPMGAAIWSASFDSFRDFPIQFICEFYKNHGLLGITDRPQWRVIKGGSRSYLAPLTASFSDRIRTSNPISKIRRKTENVHHCSASHDLGAGGNIELLVKGESEFQTFDHVVFACHSDQALRILGDQATETEREILSAFPYQPNTAVLHTQHDVLPETRRAWASWNYYNPTSPTESATVTYNMNILQSIKSKTVFCVTLNDHDRIRSENVIGTWQYHHPTFNVQRREMQGRHAEVLNVNSTSFCGAYWGNGFHEDGVNSALAVADKLQQVPAPC